MQDRVSLYPGRVTLTPVPGQENTFDLVRADQPTQEGTPLNKTSFLTDKTAALFGFDQSAVPNDIFDMLSYLVPTEKGLLTVQTVDQNGTPVKKSISVSPSINGSGVIETNAAGLFRAAVPAGTYTFSAGRSGNFEMISPETSTAEIKIGEATHVGFQFSQKTSGEIDITESKTVDIPEWLTAIDLFVVGGGGSGAAAGGSTRASGGGGGYTKTLKNQNLAGKSLSIKIGAGGAEVTHTRAGSGEHGNMGGATSISADGAEILSAGGGYAGYYFLNSGDESSFRSNGGSGGGGGLTDPKGGSDGGNGSGERGGTGQGSTTRKFGEPSNTLYSGGGGGAASKGTSTGAVSASGGSGGGGSGVALWGTSAKGGNATFYGGGGGAAVAYASYASSGYSTVSGKGYQGLASIRWNLEG